MLKYVVRFHTRYAAKLGIVDINVNHDSVTYASGLNIMINKRP